MPHAITELASLVNVTPRTVYRWIQEEKIALCDLTPEGIVSKRAAMLDKPRPKPSCQCGATNPALFSTNKHRPSGYAGECRKCAAQRMYRSRH